MVGQVYKVSTMDISIQKKQQQEQEKWKVYYREIIGP